MKVELVKIMIAMTKLTVTVLEGVFKVIKLSPKVLLMENSWTMEVKMNTLRRFKKRKTKKMI